MHSEKASLGEGEKLQGEVGEAGGSIRPAGVEIGGVAAHLLRNLVGRWRLGPADGDFDDPPASGPVGHEFAADAGVEIEDESFVERAGGERSSVEIGLGQRDPLGEQRG